MLQAVSASAELRALVPAVRGAARAARSERGRREGAGLALARRPRGRAAQPACSATSTTAGSIPAKASAPRSCRSTLGLHRRGHRPRTYRDFDAAPLDGFLRFVGAQQLHDLSPRSSRSISTPCACSACSAAPAARPACSRRCAAASTSSISTTSSNRRGGQRRRQLLARAAAVGARDQARLGRADLRRRRLCLASSDAASSTR